MPNTPIVPDDSNREVVTTLGYLNKLSHDRAALLEALEELTRYLENDERYHKHQVVHEARAAIAQAKGQA